MPFVSNSLDGSSPPATQPRSWLTEELLNYFPDTDQRVRNLRYSLDAQLLNAVALGMEDHQRRISRETRARSFQAPLNLDNRGVYYKCYVPPDFALGVTVDGDLAPPHMIQGCLPGLRQYVTLQPYDDRLPVPARAEFDASRAPVAVNDPLLFTLAGNDYPQRVASGAIAFPNRISLTLYRLPSTAGAIEVILEGIAWPSPIEDNPAPVRETVRLRDEGVAVSRLAFSSLAAVSVRGLPSGSTLEARQFLASGSIPDFARPVIDTGWREARFTRYWQIEGPLLKDTYTRGRFAGFDVAETYLCSPALGAIGIDPNTSGLWAASGTTLYYMDRRAAQPDKLAKTAMVSEPLFGLDVRYDASYPGPVRFVRLTPDGYAGASGAAQYRYLMTTPVGAVSILTPQGAIVPYTPYGGWRAGAPAELAIPLSATGTYLFTLECADASGAVTRDVCPYLNAAFRPLAAFDLSTVVPTIQGVVFDALDRLWLWTGNHLVPLRLRYDAFLFDPAERALYLTDPYDDVVLL